MTSQSIIHRAGRLGTLAVLAGLGAVATQPLAAQTQRLVIPEGTVLIVSLDQDINSQTARVGDGIITTVMDSVRLNGFTVIPQGSRIEGTVSLAKAATSRESGMVGVDFTRLVLSGGRTVAIVGKLTSPDPAERQQIEAQGVSRVVFVGGRQGAGAAIGAIGSGSANTPAGGVLGALGALLSRGADVTVPSNTTLAVQLTTALAMTVAGRADTAIDPTTLYTSLEMVRAAQTALKTRGLYRGVVDGRLNNDTRRALFNFQIENQIFATGNLDGETATELGLGSAASAAALTAPVALTVRRNTQTLVTSVRTQLGITTAGRLNQTRNYQPQELELVFALSAFADNVGVYDQLVRASTTASGIAAANAALIDAAQRVDAAMERVSVSAQTTTAWQSVQNALRAIDSQYPN
jgi:hypothetical protein